MTDIRENRPAAPPKYLRAILTPVQYRYYTGYIYAGKGLAELSIEYDRDITTICRTIKKARLRVLDYLAEQNIYKDTDSVTLERG